MARKFRIAAIVVVGLLLAAGGTALLVYRATQQVPAFYEEALAREPQAAMQANDEYLQQVTALASDLQRPGEWQAVFTAEQINGWLAVDLVSNYPDLLPEEIQAPRIAIADKQATVACRIVRGDKSTVFSLSLDVYLSEPNVLALRLRSARAGALPMPLAKVLDALTEAARHADVPLQWRQNAGDPVALVSLAQARDAGEFGQIDCVELRDGALWISGHTAEKTPPALHDPLPQSEETPAGDEALSADELPVAIAPPITARGELPADSDSSEAEDSLAPEPDETQTERDENERDRVNDDASLQTLEAEMKRIDQR